MRVNVVKVGSSVLRGPKGIDTNFIDGIASEIASLMSEGERFVLVSSGAILCGVVKLGLKKPPQDIVLRQALAGIGQIELMRIWEETFSEKGVETAQILLTYDDLGQSERALNARNTMVALFRYNAVPIINENDSVAIDEIKVGDNDLLSAYVSALCDATRLIIVSDAEGVRDEKGEVVRTIEEPEEFLKRGVAKGTSDPLRRGGMITKLEASRICSSFGISTYIVGRTKHLIRRIIEGENLGTFIPPKKSVRKKRLWIGLLRTKGQIIVDEGAKKAMEEGKSLLASGIVGVKGDFKRGDIVSILAEAGEKVAKGITNYSSREIELVKGKKSAEILKVLGYSYSDEIVHRDNMFFK